MVIIFTTSLGLNIIFDEYLLSSFAHLFFLFFKHNKIYSNHGFSSHKSFQIPPTYITQLNSMTSFSVFLENGQKQTNEP